MNIKPLSLCFGLLAAFPANANDDVQHDDCMSKGNQIVAGFTVDKGGLLNVAFYYEGDIYNVHSDDEKFPGHHSVTSLRLSELDWLDEQTLNELVPLIVDLQKTVDRFYEEAHDLADAQDIPDLNISILYRGGRIDFHQEYTGSDGNLVTLSNEDYTHNNESVDSDKPRLTMDNLATIFASWHENFVKDISTSLCVIRDTAPRPKSGP